MDDIVVGIACVLFLFITLYLVYMGGEFSRKLKTKSRRAPLFIGALLMLCGFGAWLYAANFPAILAVTVIGTFSLAFGAGVLYQERERIMGRN
jgi:heme A synthase